MANLTLFVLQFIVTQSNKLYTWGASPQHVRLINTTRRRERLTKKVAEATNAQDNEQDGESSGSGDTDQASTEQTNGNVANTVSESDSTTESSNSSSPSDKKAKHTKILEERIKSLWRARTIKRIPMPRSPAMANVKPYEKSEYVDDEYTDHFYPSQVNTSQVDANITQVD